MTTVETNTAEISVVDGPVVVFRSLPGTRVELEHVRSNNELIAELGNGSKIRLLADIRGIRSMTHEARTESQAWAESHYDAVAVLVGNPVSRVLGNFFMGINKPKITTKLFDDEGEALEWLRSLDLED